jgi:hypothetical protein
MGNQRTFASMAWNGKGKVTRRERFLMKRSARRARERAESINAWSSAYCNAHRPALHQY